MTRYLFGVYSVSNWYVVGLPRDILLLACRWEPFSWLASLFGIYYYLFGIILSIRCLVVFSFGGGRGEKRWQRQHALMSISGHHQLDCRDFVIWGRKHSPIIKKGKSHTYRIHEEKKNEALKTEPVKKNWHKKQNEEDTKHQLKKKKSRNEK